VTVRRAPFLALVALLLASGCGGKPAQPTGSPSPGAPGTTPTSTALPIKVTSNRVGKRFVTLTEQKRGRKVYVLRADANESDRFAAGTGRSVFTRPHIVFFEAGGKTLTADAPTATVEEVTKTVVMSGGVHARTQDGIQLTCDTLRYDDRNEHIHGTGNVLVTTPRGERLEGSTIDADTRLDHVRISGAQSAP
jgi:LPS export ABC transporter protein LptC